MRSKILISAVVFALVYVLGYGVARWRKFVVMQECYVKEEGLEVRRTRPGSDVRDDWRGRFKNRASPILFSIYRPLCAMEDFVRGGRRTIR
jgi:hypothetical protein